MINSYSKVYQYDSDGLLKIWPSIKSITDAGFRQSSIYKCLKGRQQKAGGFHWFPENI